MDVCRDHGEELSPLAGMSAAGNKDGSTVNLGIRGK
jgi:hypothetical protein